MLMDKAWQGNVYDKVPAVRGWFVGHFMPLDDVRHSEDVELKWLNHQKGEERQGVTPRDDCTTISILIDGSFSIKVEDANYELVNQGDYVIWKPGLKHTW